jgi:uncharacterized membrane protein
MKRISFILILIASILIITALPTYANTGGAEGLTTVRGKVIEVIADMDSNDLGADSTSPVQGRQVVKVRVLDGEYKNKEFIVENNLGGTEFFNIRVEKNDSVLLMLDETGDKLRVNISSFARDRYIYFTIILFALLLVVVGRLKGLKAVITLTATILLIWKYMLPSILNGSNPITVSVITSIIITVFTLTFIAGFNKKSYSAILGTIAGVTIAAVIAFAIGSLAKLTGLSSEEAVMLMYLPSGIEFDFKGLLFAGIIIGTLGAVMDVSISIASSMDEVKKVNSEISKYSLIKSGMNVGKDIMGTMTNTLILAYTGASIPILLIFLSYNTSMVEIINLDVIATEIIRAITGSIGIVLTIPFTAIFAGLLE